MKQLRILTFGCATTKSNSKFSFILNGTQSPLKQVIGGKDIPQIVFQTQKLIITESIYTLTAESVDRGTLKYKNGKMEIYGKEVVNSVKNFTAIYKIGNDQLTICYNLKGDVYSANFETKSAPTLFFSVFKKQ